MEVSCEGVEATGGHPTADGVKVVGESAEADGGVVSALQKKLIIVRKMSETIMT